MSLVCYALFIIMHHASWHPFHHVKHAYVITYSVRDEKMRVDQVSGRSIHQRCWCLLELSEGKLTSLQQRQAPNIQLLFCFINTLLHFKSSVMCIKLVGVG
jgi:hypothetical protein